tara:strand:+ start:1161 stop:1493 length:333 start_codon:yes stop_codon:yes gene_type:complete
METKNYDLNNLKKEAEKELYFEYSVYADDEVAELSKYSSIDEAIDEIAWKLIPNDIYDLFQYVANDPELLRIDPNAGLKISASTQEIHSYISMNIYYSLCDHLENQEGVK